MPRATPGQTSFNGGIYSDLLDGHIDAPRRNVSVKEMLNMIALKQGPAARRGGTRFIREVKDSAKRTDFIKFEFNVLDVGMLEFGDLYFRPYKDRAVILNGGSPVEIVTPYTQAALFDADGLFQVKFEQSFDVIYLFHPDFQTRVIKRISDTVWEVNKLVFLDGPYLATNITTTTLTPSATSGSITITASAITGINDDTGFQTTDVGRLIRLKGSTGNQTWLEITAHTSTTIVTATVKGPNLPNTNAVTAWRLGLYSDTTGFPVDGKLFQSRLAMGGSRAAPTRVDLSQSNGFSADDVNFEPTEVDGTVNPDNAIAVPTSASNPIHWISNNEAGLILGTAGREWVVRPSRLNEALTPANARAEEATQRGSANLAPVKAGLAILHIHQARQKLHELIFDVDRFRNPDLTALAEGVTRTGLTCITYQQEPITTIWGPRGDGLLTGLTYERDEDVIGWHLHQIGGFSDLARTKNAAVESVSSIPTPAGDRDDLWLIVRRVIDGVTRRYIEVMERHYESDIDQRDAFHVDSGGTLDDPKIITGATQANPVVVTSVGHGFSNDDFIDQEDVIGMTEINDQRFKIANVTANTYELRDKNGVNIDGTAFTAYIDGGEARKAVGTVTGLGHLEGETLVVMIDGRSHPDLLVTGGTITLANGRLASRIQHGLGFQWRLRTLTPEAGSADGVAQGKIKRINRVLIRLKDTLDFNYGPDDDQLDEEDFDNFTAFDTTSPLFTGDIEVAWPGGYETGASMLFVGNGPFPAQIQIVIPRMKTYN